MAPHLNEVTSWFSLTFYLLGGFFYLFAAVYYLRRLYVHAKRERPQENIVKGSSIRGSVIKIEQQEPSRRPPAILNMVLIICSLLFLALGVFGIYLWVAGKATVRVDISTIFFFILFIGLPVLILGDIFIIQRRFYKLGRSCVAKEAILVLDVDASTAFDTSRVVLDAMKATVIKMNKPRLLKASSGKCVITVEVRGIKGSKSRVHVLSDSQWLTVKWDAGANQKCIDAFQSQLNKQLRQP